MTRTFILDKDQQPTQEQLLQIEKAAELPVVYDKDSPEMTPAMEKAFRLAARNRNRLEKLRIS